MSSDLDKLRELTDILEVKEKDLFHSWGVFSQFLVDGLVVAFIKDFDHEGRFVWQNDAYLQAFRLKKEDQLGKSDFECWDERTARHLREHDVQIWETGKPIVLFESVPTNGKQGWFVYKFPFTESGTGKRMIGGFAIKLPADFKMEYS